MLQDATSYYENRHMQSNLAISSKMHTKIREVVVEKSCGRLETGGKSIEISMELPMYSDVLGDFDMSSAGKDLMRKIVGKRYGERMYNI